MKNLFAGLLLVGSLGLNAQLSEIDIHSGVGFPQNEFKDNFDQEIYSLGTSVLFSNPSSEFFEYGFDINYARTNTVEGDVRILVNDHATNGSLDVISSEINTALKGRLIPYRGTVQPYIEVNAGTNTYFTKSEIKTKISYLNQDEQMVNKTVSTAKDGMVDGMNFYAGWTVGSKFKLSEHFLIKAEMSRTYTTQARYLDPASVTISNNGFLDYNFIQSGTSQIKTSLGLIYKF